MNTRTHPHTHTRARTFSIVSPLTACEWVMDCSSGSAGNIIFSIPPDPTPICHNCHLFPAWSPTIRWLFFFFFFYTEHTLWRCQDDEHFKCARTHPHARAYILYEHVSLSVLMFIYLVSFKKRSPTTRERLAGSAWLIAVQRGSCRCIYTQTNSQPLSYVPSQSDCVQIITHTLMLRDGAPISVRNVFMAGARKM